MNQRVDQKNLYIEPIAKPAFPLMQSTATTAVLHDHFGASEVKLLQLRDRHRALMEQRVPLKEERERLWGVATTEWKILGLSIDDNIDQWKAHIERSGYVQAENADNQVLDTIIKVEEDIRSIPATSFAGLSAKLAVVRNNLGSEFSDDQPREDQDWHVFLLNEFADEVTRLESRVSDVQAQHSPNSQAANADPMLEAICAFRAGQAAFMAIPIEQITDENEEALAASTYMPPQDAILRNAPHTPKVTSIAGVREAIRLTFETEALIDCMAENALREALAYLDGADLAVRHLDQEAIGD